MATGLIGLCLIFRHIEKSRPLSTKQVTKRNLTKSYPQVIHRLGEEGEKEGRRQKGGTIGGEDGCWEIEGVGGAEVSENEVVESIVIVKIYKKKSSKYLSART